MNLLSLNDHDMRQLLVPAALLDALAESFVADSIKPPRRPIAARAKSRTDVLLTMPGWESAAALAVKMVLFLANSRASVQGLGH